MEGSPNGIDIATSGAARSLHASAVRAARNNIADVYLLPRVTRNTCHHPGLPA